MFTFICHALVLETPVSMSILMSLQESEASMNMCWPVFTPQIVGGALPPKGIANKTHILRGHVHQVSCFFQNYHFQPLMLICLYMLDLIINHFLKFLQSP